MTTATKTYPYAVIDAPGYCGNRARVYSRHGSLEDARKSIKGHVGYCILERSTSADTDHVLWSGIRAAGYPLHD